MALIWSKLTMPLVWEDKLEYGETVSTLRCDAFVYFNSVVAEPNGPSWFVSVWGKQGHRSPTSVREDMDSFGAHSIEIPWLRNQWARPAELSGYLQTFLRLWCWWKALGTRITCHTREKEKMPQGGSTVSYQTVLEIRPVRRPIFCCVRNVNHWLDPPDMRGHRFRSAKKVAGEGSRHSSFLQTLTASLF